MCMSVFRKGLLAVCIAGVLLATGMLCSAAPVTTVALPEKEVRAVVERYLADKLAGRGWQTSISRLSLPQGVRVPAGIRDLELIVPAGWGGWGPVSAALMVRVNGVLEKNLPIRLQVDARTKMVTATRQLLAGTVLQEQDLTVELQDLAKADGVPVMNLQDAVGKKTRVTVRAGAPLKNTQLASVPVVVSGQLVTIIAENESLRITVTGRAKSSGAVGDLIRVQNLSSNREIPARVVDASTVQVGL